MLSRNVLACMFVALNVNTVLACGPLLQNYPFECALQDKYQAVSDSLTKDFGVNPEYTVSYRAMRLIGEDEYDRRRKEVNYMPWKIYEPAPETWILWERGSWMVDRMVEETTFKPLTIEDVESLNRVLISKNMMTKLSLLKLNKPGRIRSLINFLPPGAEFKCGENPMSEEDYKLISNYDLKDYEGKPLMDPHFKKCKGKGYGGEIWYMKSSKVRKELQRWLNDFNSNFEKYLKGETLTRSPIEFIVDSQRWFIAIHPFGDGNGRTSRFIQDLFLKKLGLPFMPTGRISMLSPRDEYVTRSKQEIKRGVKYLETCLTGYEKRKANSKVTIHGHCLPMYDDVDTGEAANLKKERSEFAKVLKESLEELEKKGLDN